MPTLSLSRFPDYFMAYSWLNHNHATHGYPGDSYPDFPWVKSLEERGAWLAAKHPVLSAPTNYIRSILAWGAGQSDPTMRFEARLGNVNLLDVFNEIVISIADPKLAIKAALEIPGCGLTYASKLLRFMRPELHASLDSRIREALLKTRLLPKVTDGNTNSMIKGYVAFQSFCVDLIAQLEASGIKRPDCALPAGKGRMGWRVADVEMALFMWAAATLKTPANELEA